MSESLPDATMAKESVAALPGARTCRCGCGGVLTGRQRAFASGACRARWFDLAHPRINRSEAGPRRGTLKAAILTYLRENPGEHTEQQIADAIHAFAHSVGARLSELYRAGEPIEKRRGPGNVRLYRWAA